MPFRSEMRPRRRVTGAALSRLCAAALIGSTVLAAGLGPGAASPAQAADLAAAPADLRGVWMRPTRDLKEPRLIVPAMPPPPLRAPHKQAYEALRKKMAAAEERGDPIDFDRANCIPDGMPKLMGSTLPFEILQEPGKIVILVEFGAQVRHIYLDGSKHPPDDELEYNFFGHSIGRWEGSTLVVETVGIQKSTTLFDYVPHGENLKIVERYKLSAPDLLELTMEMVDPEFLTEPWIVTRKYLKRPDLKIREFVCQENNR
jgi:hypothetical protein